VQNGRLVQRRKAGLNPRVGVFWHGERCEKVVADRVAGYPTKAARRQRNGRSAPKAGVPSSKLLRRLYRALKRRKTLAGQQSVQRRIDALEKELGC
jgi:hypothetical protein